MALKTAELPKMCSPDLTGENTEQLVNGDEGATTPQSPQSPDVPTTSASTTANPWRNRNVILTLVWGVVAGIADSVWSNTVLSGFLYALAQAMHSSGNKDDDNTLVGSAEAVQGIAMLLSALPVGLVADWFGKARVVAYGGVLIIIAIVVTFAALWQAKQAVEDNEEPDARGARHAYYWMLGALALWGIGQGVLAGPSQALFADSIPKGQRSSLMTWQYSSYLLSSVVGPIVGVILLSRHANGAEDSWSLAEIFPVFVVGVLLEIPGVIIMFLFSDKHTIV